MTGAVPVVTVYVTPGNTILVTSTRSVSATYVTVVTTSTVVAVQTLTPSYSPTTQTTTVTLTPAMSTIVVIPGLTTDTAGSAVCATGYNACPASVGGGCCPTDRACAFDAVCVPLETALTTVLSTVTEANPAIRPTSASTGTGSVAVVYTTSTTTIPGALGGSAATTSTLPSGSGTCPSGYFLCSAYILGCCQNGRNCDTTSCPASATNEVVISSGVTIEVPVTTGSTAGGVGGAVSGRTTVTESANRATSTRTTTVGTGGAATGAQGSCPTSWYSCGADVGGGCCPTGYVCGSTCSASAITDGPGSVNKVAPASQAVRLDGWAERMTILMVAVGVVMLWL